MVYFKANQVEAASKDVEGAFSGPRECGWQVPSSKFQDQEFVIVTKCSRSGCGNSYPRYQVIKVNIAKELQRSDGL